MAMTPFMQQYCELKEQYREYILFFRLGDFYEMFYDDAKTASRELELVLTGKDCGEEERAPMCGIPYHSVEGYIARLVSKGYKIAICEQLEDPALAKGIVKRDVVRIITPGTVTEGSMLDDSSNNYLCSVYRCAEGYGLGFIDISTGKITATLLEGADADERLINELAAFTPKEILTNVDKTALGKVNDYIKERLCAVMNDWQEKKFERTGCELRVSSQFGTDSAQALAVPAITCAIGALLAYVAETQKTDISYIRDLTIYSGGQYMELDVNTRRNLELCASMRTGEKKGTLLWVIDRTKTAMGARMLRSWLEMPLTSSRQIAKRQRAVAELFDALPEREEIIETLRGLPDLERLNTKVVYNSANARDLRAIADILSVVPHLREVLSGFSCDELKEVVKELENVDDLAAMIYDTIREDDLPFSIREGGFIRPGFHETVDQLRSVINDSQSWIDRITEREREATGIKNLKISSNKVFGYYIEVTNSFKDLVPPTYIRKQTLTGAERYITEELKEMESMMYGAKDKLEALEYALFQSLREKVAAASARLLKTASLLSRIDVYQSLATVAAKNHYVCPEVDDSDVISITDGRHPVVERFSGDDYFVPNDTDMNTGNARMLIVTGPNMAGKSTYMRQIALITVLAQIGSFVPAREAHLGIVDRLFTRVGASDDLAQGQSTFMLEMTEVAYILSHATKRSLVIYDEIGRGTSTFDGMSIARAVCEYTMSRKIGAKTLFATHYHELTELEGQYDGVVNYHIAAKKRGEDLIFLRKIVRGAADDSYGIEVAQLAGVPKDVTKRAHEILRSLESGEIPTSPKKAPKEPEELPPLSLADYAVNEVKESILSTDLNTLTPIEAMNLIYQWKKTLN